MLDVQACLLQIDRNIVCLKVASKFCVIIKVALCCRYASSSGVLGSNCSNMLTALIWQILIDSWQRISSLCFSRLLSR